MTLIALGLPRSGTTLCKQIFKRVFNDILFTHTLDDSFNDIDLFIIRDIRDAIVSLKQTEKFDFSKLENRTDLDEVLNFNFVLDSAANIFPKTKADSFILRYEDFSLDKNIIYDSIQNKFNVILDENKRIELNEETSLEKNKSIQDQFSSFEQYDKESGIHGNHLNGGEIGKWTKLIPKHLHAAFIIRIIERIGIDAYKFFTNENNIDIMEEESKYKYNSWPIGRLPKEWQRPELDQLKENGYDWKDPRDVIDIFEQKVAAYSGSKYAVSCDCCSHGLFLSLKYLQYTGEINSDTVITIPKRTYISPPMQILIAGAKVEFEDLEWTGMYQFKPTRIFDAAVRFTKGMYVGNDALQIVSFQLKKRVPIGKGGVILTDSEEAYKWLKLASYDGRDLRIPYTDDNHIQMLGYHMYMTPEDAARGILLMDRVPEENEDSGNHLTYTDVSKLFTNDKFIGHNG